MWVTEEDYQEMTTLPVKNFSFYQSSTATIMGHNKSPQNSKASSNKHLFRSYVSRSVTLVGSAGLGRPAPALGSPSCCC